jgi:hypothetical protein
MTAFKIAIGIAVVMASYAGFHVQSATDEVITAELQEHQCASQECATVFTMPPSSNLFL